MLNLAAVQEPSERGGNDRLREIIRSKSVIAGREMRLASGRTSNIYFDLKPTMFDQEGANLLAEALLGLLSKETFDSVGGLAVGAVPLVEAVAIRSHNLIKLRAFFVRSEVKEHGTKERIEANFNNDDRVIILDDVTTTGGSVMKAIDAVRARGATVVKVITVVDRQEGAQEKLANEGIEMVALYRKDEFMV
jgi:orotate phosphoribosyltransferase